MNEMCYNRGMDDKERAIMEKATIGITSRISAKMALEVSRRGLSMSEAVRRGLELLLGSSSGRDYKDLMSKARTYDELGDIYVEYVNSIGEGDGDPEVISMHNQMMNKLASEEF